MLRKNKFWLNKKAAGLPATSTKSIIYTQSIQFDLFESSFEANFTHGIFTIPGNYLKPFWFYILVIINCFKQLLLSINIQAYK